MSCSAVMRPSVMLRPSMLLLLVGAAIVAILHFSFAIVAARMVLH